VRFLWSAMLKQHPKTTHLARRLRECETWGERLMWSWLRDKRFSEYKFRRQHPVGPHFLDFFCIEARLNIEVDGSQHGLPEIRSPMPDAILFWQRKESKCCGFGIPGCGVRKKWSAIPSGGRCRNARRIRCRIIARPLSKLRVKTNRRECI
jgi:hypothetical protein